MLLPERHCHHITALHLWIGDVTYKKGLILSLHLLDRLPNVDTVVIDDKVLDIVRRASAPAQSTVNGAFTELAYIVELLFKHAERIKTLKIGWTSKSYD